jgi:hypothetical protein
MEVAKLTVRIGKFVCYWARSLRPTPSNLGEFVFKATDHVDAHPMLAPGDGIKYRRAARFYDAGDDEARPPSINVDLEINLAENWRMHFFERGREHVENRRAGLSVLAAQNTEQRLPLRIVGPLVDDDGSFAFAFVDSARPLKNPGSLKAVEPCTPVMTGIDLNPNNGSACPVCGQSVELAGTAVRAIAISKFTRLDRPFDVGHCSLPGFLAAPVKDRDDYLELGAR